MVGDPYEAIDDPACYPDTTVLINLPGLRDQAELDAFERVEVGERSFDPPFARAGFQSLFVIARRAKRSAGQQNDDPARLLRRGGAASRNDRFENTLYSGQSACARQAAPASGLTYGHEGKTKHRGDLSRPSPR